MMIKINVYRAGISAFAIGGTTVGIEFQTMEAFQGGTGASNTAYPWF